MNDAVRGKRNGGIMQYDENAEKYGYEGEMTPLKCDKLTAYKGDIYIPVYGTIADAEVYLKKDADTAIAELKEAWRSEHEACEALKAELDKAIAERDGNQVCIDALKEKLMPCLNGDCILTCEVVEKYGKEIAELKEERHWRKFPEEKPKWGEEVLVVDYESKQYIVRFSHDMKWISWGKMNTCKSNCVKYWMPLPKAPEEADK